MAAPAVIGLHRAVRLPGLAALVWFANLLLAAVVTAPFIIRLHAALAHAPGGDRLLEGFSFGLLADLAREHGGLLGPLALAALLVVPVVLLVNAFAVGGTFAVLGGDRTGGVMERFGAGGMRFLGRFLRVGVLAGVVFVIAIAAIIVATAAAMRPLWQSTWEPAPVVGWMAGGTVAGLAGLIVLLALDLARARIVRDDRSRVTRAFAGSLWLVLGHPLATLGLWAALAALFGAVLAAYLGARQVLPATSWGGIALMVLLQQVVMLARAGLRVALCAGEVELLERFRPAAAVAGLPAVPDEPSLELAPRELPLAE